MALTIHGTGALSSPYQETAHRTSEPEDQHPRSGRSGSARCPILSSRAASRFGEASASPQSAVGLARETVGPLEHSSSEDCNGALPAIARPRCAKPKGLARPALIPRRAAVSAAWSKFAMAAGASPLLSCARPKKDAQEVDTKEVPTAHLPGCSPSVRTASRPRRFRADPEAMQSRGSAWPAPAIVGFPIFSAAAERPLRGLGRSSGPWPRKPD